MFLGWWYFLTIYWRFKVEGLHSTTYRCVAKHKADSPTISQSAAKRRPVHPLDDPCLKVQNYQWQ